MHIQATCTCRCHPQPGGTHGTVCIDDVTIEPTPDCIEVFYLETTDVGSNSVTLGWTDTYEYSAHSIYIINGGDTTLVEDCVYGNSHTITGLESNTGYTFGVQVNCAVSNSTIEAIGAHTLCAVESVPFFCGCNQPLSGTCWLSAMELVDNVLAGGAFQYFPYPLWQHTYGELYGLMSGEQYSVMCYPYCTDWLITPKIDLTEVGSARLCFDMAIAGPDGEAPTFDGSERFMVLVSPDGGDTWTVNDANVWTVADSGNNNTLADVAHDHFERYTVDLNPFVFDTIRIAFYCEDTNGYGIYTKYIHIDNITVEQVPECPPITSVTLDSLDGTTAYIHWTSSPTSYYEVDVLEWIEGQWLTTGTVNISADDTTAVVSNMEYHHNYRVVVRTLCSTASYSPWSIPLDINPGYCHPFSNNGLTIASVAFGIGQTIVCNTTSHPVEIPYYGDYTAMNGAIPAGLTAELDITTTGQFSYSFHTTVWVDWNRDVAFDSSEMVFDGQSSTTQPGNIVATFPIPTTQDTGSYRMRIALATNSVSAAIQDPCYIISNGIAVTEDYTLTVLERLAYLPVTGLRVDSVGAHNIFLSWEDTLNNDVSYIVYDMSDTSVIATDIAPTTYEVTGLEEMTRYTLGVSASNSEGEQSLIASITAITNCSGDNCQIAIVSDPSDFDHWENKSIIITQNDSTINTFPSILIPACNFLVCSSVPVSFRWEQLYNQPTPHFSIFNRLGCNVYSFTSNHLDNGKFFTLHNICPEGDAFMLTVIGHNYYDQGTSDPAPGIYQLAEGDSMTVVSLPNDGYKPSFWTCHNLGPAVVFRDTIVIGGHNYNWEAGKVVSVMPFFAGREYNANVSINDSSMGYVTHNHNLPYGSLLNLTAHPYEGYHFVHWEIEGDTITINPYSLNLYNDIDVHCVFAEGTVGIDEASVSAGNITIVDGRIRIDSDSDYHVFDIMGREMASGKHSGQTDELPAGVYMVRLGSNPVRRVIVIK